MWLNSGVDLANKIWNSFNYQKKVDYHDLYLKSDVILLADVFEKFRCLLKEIYDFNSCHYDSVPNIPWDAKLKSTGVE